MTRFQHVTPEDIEFFHRLVGRQYVYTDVDAMHNYARDETPDESLRCLPEAVVKPEKAEQIQQLLQYCSAHRIPVTPRGAGSGLSGGAIPVEGGVVLSLERMNRILEIDRDNLVVVVEPGVVTNEINRKLKSLGLYYAGYPMSLETCQIGGNVAENAGGGRAVKYGVTGHYVRGLEFVTAQGELVHFGGKSAKDVSAYDVTHLLIGSEGTLGVVTKIFLKVVPLPRFRAVLLAPFARETEALGMPGVILSEMGMLPSSLEYMNRTSLEFGYTYTRRTFPFPDSACHLLVEVDGNDEETLFRDYRVIGERLKKEGAREVFVADNPVALEDMWVIRRGIPEAVHLALPREINEDVTVPIASVPELVNAVAGFRSEYHLITPVYGHIGDGNLHLTLAPEEPSDWDGNDREQEIRKKLYEKVIALGGVLTGEHGVGLKRRAYLDLFYSPAEIALLKRIKAAFDPVGILNPGKIFPAGEGCEMSEVRSEKGGGHEKKGN